jgi:integrase
VKPAMIKLPGTHRVKKRLASGRIAFYWYGTRGGPLLMKFEGDNHVEALRAESAGAADLAASYAASTIRPEPTIQTIRTLITKFKVAPDGFERIAESTKIEWRRSLDVIDKDFGDLPTKLLGAKGVRTEIIAWRNRRKATPRQADIHLDVLQRLLSWALKNELTDANPATGIERISRTNRADKVVETEELKAILANVTPRASIAIRLAAATGLRREDLLKIQWDHVKDSYITFGTGKSRGRKIVSVPIYGDARAVIDALRKERDEMVAEEKVPSAYVLTTEFGGRWSSDSLTQAFGRAARKLKIEKRLNDLRGTAITRFILKGLTNEQVADIVGWDLKRIDSIRKHYVDPNRIALGLISQLEKGEATS